MTLPKIDHVFYIACDLHFLLVSDLVWPVANAWARPVVAMEQLLNAKKSPKKFYLLHQSRWKCLFFPLCFLQCKHIVLRLWMSRWRFLTYCCCSGEVLRSLSSWPLDEGHHPKCISHQTQSSMKVTDSSVLGSLWAELKNLLTFLLYIELLRKHNNNLHGVSI